MMRELAVPLFVRRAVAWHEIANVEIRKSKGVSPRKRGRPCGGPMQ